MENGLEILAIVALLFLSMYGYTYGAVALENIKQDKLEKQQMMLEELMLEERKRKQVIREEKLRKQTKRREEIKRELRFLENMKLSNNDEMNKLRVEKMKQKKVS